MQVGSLALLDRRDRVRVSRVQGRFALVRMRGGSLWVTQDRLIALTTCEACGIRQARLGEELCSGCMEEIDPRHVDERPRADEQWADRMAELAAWMDKEGLL